MVPLILGNAHILRSPSIERNKLLGLAMGVGSSYYRGLNHDQVEDVEIFLK